jgi:hypothetical protein
MIYEYLKITIKPDRGTMQAAGRRSRPHRAFSFSRLIIALAAVVRRGKEVGP